jgi:PilZ domain
MAVREHAQITAVYQMTIDLEEEHNIDRTRVLKSGSIWSGDERRKHPRAEVDEPAYIFVGGSSTSCRVLNVSTEGAAIDVPNPSFVPDWFQLMTEKDRVIRNCRLVWIRENRIGVVFEN